MDKKNILKVVAIILILLLFIFIIYFGRKFIIINKLVKERESFLSSNYSGLLSLQQADGSNVTVEYKYKDGKSVEIEKLTNSDSSNWTSTTWIDRNTKERVVLNEYSNGEPSQVTQTEFQDVSLFINNWMISLSNDFSTVLNYSIKNETKDGKEYYALTPKYKGAGGTTYYFEKDTLLLTEISIQSQVMHFSDLKVNSVTDNDVSKPDLTKYTTNDNS